MLGICLGMQLLFESSVENEGASGLGLLGGVVAPLEANGYKVPHIGWSPVHWEHDSRAHRRDWARRRPSTSSTHSRPGRRPMATCSAPPRTGERFACAVERPPLYGVQFHPEKSSSAGLGLLANFVRICS